MTTTVAPLIFAIIALNISTPIEQYEYFYSVNIQVNIPCPSKRESNITFIFQPSLYDSNEIKQCFSSSKNHSLIKCENLTYGVHYTIDGSIACGRKNFSLSKEETIYEIGKAKYINSTFNSTSIDTLFFLPGLFYRLIIELTNVNKNCSIEYSLTNSPFYHCSFHNLTPAQKFDLKYYTLTKDDQSQSVNETIVYTDLEDFNFSCQLNKTNQQIYFFWSNLIGSNYLNLRISVSKKENKASWNIFCDPYISQVNCSTRLESGQEYEIKGILKTNLRNYYGEKSGTCSIRTELSPISTRLLGHKFLNDTTVRLNWFEHFSFDVKVRLKNVETNIFEYPHEDNRTNALFINLTEASIYEVEFNISKINYPSLIQRTNYSIKTDIEKIFIKNVVRLSSNSLIININEYNLTKFHVIYCIEQLIEKNFSICSTSNQFNQLLPATIYNLSIVVYRDSFQNISSRKNQTTFKLINTNPSPLKICPWKTNVSCGIELLNRFSLPYSSECISNETRVDCNELECDSQYEFKIIFNQTEINSLCSTSSSLCDIQLNDSNLTSVQFKTSLAAVENLRIISNSSKLGKIEVSYDPPNQCYDQLILICEAKLSKHRKTFPNSTICTDLIPNEFYRIYVETKRLGWESVNSTEIEFILPSSKGGRIGQYVVIACIIGIFIVLILSLFVYRRRHQKKSIKIQASEEQCQLSLEEKPQEEQHHEPSIDEKRDQTEPLQTEQESNQVEQTNSCSTE